MKTLAASLFALTFAAASSFAGGFGPGPWANGAYYDGQFNGRYQAVVTGENISGVLGFSLLDGAPTLRGAAVDNTANYFMIFVEGRTYVGQTLASINIDTKKVGGALQGTAPAGNIAIPAPTFDASDALPIVNRGLSGGFTANINNSKATFSFSGNGQLSTPANAQTIVLQATPEETGGGGTVPAGTIVTETIDGIIITETTPFQLSGIKTSNTAANVAAAAQ
jgi:hypothetical protein